MSTVTNSSSQGLTTEEAFMKLVENPEFWEKTGSTNNLRRQFLYMLNNGEGISFEKKREMLTAAGFEVEKEIIWELPPEPEPKLQPKRKRIRKSKTN